VYEHQDDARSEVLAGSHWRAREHERKPLRGPGARYDPVMALTRNPLHIGAGGELLVQYQLLKRGIDSARMTTDAGIDLVVYAPHAQEATTVQVKTVDRATPSGGTGKMAIGWNFPHSTPAQLLAFVLLERDIVWLFTRGQARATAQQHTDKGGRRIYWYTDLAVPQRPDGSPLIETDLDQYLLERQAPILFPTANAPSWRLEGCRTTMTGYRDKDR
jgi:hypothetical protein